MNGLQFGSRVRAVRLRRNLRQRDVASLAGVSQSTASRIERGHVETLRLRDIERVADVLEIRVDLVARWRAGDLDRLVNAGHAAMHEAIAAWFQARWPAWVPAHEVSFSIYGERGVIDVVAWHAARRALLVIELKTQVVDLNELVGVVDRKRRLAAQAVRERGWRPDTVGAWVAVAESRTNRRRIDTHAAFLHDAYPARGRELREWLRRPDRPLSALSLETFGSRGPVLARRRVRVGGFPAITARRRVAAPGRVRRSGHDAGGEVE